MYSKKERNTMKLDTLLKQDRKLFHTKDLELLWGIGNRQTLHTTIQRYTKKSILIPIYRGFYSTVPIEKIDPIELGASVIHSYCYLSTESILSQNGIIFQSINSYTFCSSNNKRFMIDNSTYLSRQLKDIYLYNTAGIIDKETYKIASIERALADMLYFNPRYYFDAKDHINWDKVNAIRKEVYKK